MEKRKPLIWEKAPIGYALLKAIYNHNEILVDFVVEEANEAFEQCTGFLRNEIMGEKLSLIITESTENKEYWVESCKEAAIQRKQIDLAQYQPLHDRWYKVFTCSTQQNYVEVFFSDITKEMHEIDKNNVILTAVNDIIFELSEEYVFENVIVSDEAFLFLPREFILGNRVQELFAGELSKLMLSAFEQAKASGRKEHIVYKSPIHGEKRWFEADVIFKVMMNNKSKYIVSIREITKQKETELELERKKEEIERFFDIIPEILCIADMDGNFIKINSAWSKALGYPMETLLQSKFTDFVHPEDKNATYDAVAQLADNKPVLNFTNRYRCSDGSYRYFEWSSQPYGKLIYAAARDITERCKLEEKLQKSEKSLRQLAMKLENQNLQLFETVTIDKLTGIRNRYYFETCAGEEISNTISHKTRLSLLLFDLDKFKTVNDTYGHDVGDQVLIRICNTVQKLIRKSDIFARWGGEEFVILLPGVNLEGACIVAEKVRAAVEGIDHMLVGKVTVSIGVAEYRAGESIGDWFKIVDKEMYKAKDLGRNCISYSKD